MQLTPAEYERLRIIVWAKVRARVALIACHPHLDRDDLQQDAMIRAIAAHETYLPPHSYSSWIGRAADCAILDTLKKANGRGLPRPKVESFSPQNEPFFTECAGKLDRNNESFAAVALMVARETFRRWSTGGGRHRFERPSMIACCCIKRESNWSWRELVLLLAGPSLLEAVEMPSVPHESTIRKWERENKRKVSLVHGRVRRVFEAYS